MNAAHPADRREAARAERERRRRELAQDAAARSRLEMLISQALRLLESAGWPGPVQLKMGWWSREMLAWPIARTRVRKKPGSGSECYERRILYLRRDGRLVWTEGTSRGVWTAQDAPARTTDLALPGVERLIAKYGESLDERQAPSP